MSSINSSTFSLKEENDFCLNGSQINLSCRPLRSNKPELNGKLNRPVSAQYIQSNLKKDTKKYINRKRPKSADYNCPLKLGMSLFDQKPKFKSNKNFTKDVPIFHKKEETPQHENSKDCVLSQTVDECIITQDKLFNKCSDNNKWANYSKSNERRSLNDNLNLESCSDHSLEEITDFINQEFNPDLDSSKLFSSNPSGDTVNNFVNSLDDQSIETFGLKSQPTISNPSKLESHHNYSIQNYYSELDNVLDLKQSTNLLEDILTLKNSCDPELELIEAEQRTNTFFKSFNEVNYMEKDKDIGPHTDSISLNKTNNNFICGEFSKVKKIKKENTQKFSHTKAKNKTHDLNSSEEKKSTTHVRFNLGEINGNISSSSNKKTTIKNNDKKLKTDSPKIISKCISSNSKDLRDSSSSSGEHYPREEVPEKTVDIFPKIIQEERFQYESETNPEDLKLNEQNFLKNKNDFEILASNRKKDQSTDIINETIQDSGDKLQDILNYLDQVDERCDHVLEIAKARANLESPVLQKTEIGNLESLEILLNSSNVDLAHEIITLRLQIEEKVNCVNLLQKTLNQQRELNVKNNKNSEKELKLRLKEQKKHYENITSRHQKFINQIIEEKNTLTEKCESLLRELQRSQERFKNNLHAIEERHCLEIKRLKERQIVGEKARRSRWAEQNAQALKEATVRGLEPELDRISRDHKEEIVRLRTIHRQEIENLELKAARNTQQQMAELRELLEKDKIEAIKRECDNLRIKLSREEAALDDERNKLITENKRLKEKFNEEEIRLKKEIEDVKISLERETKEIIKATQSECQSILASTERRHQVELETTKEKVHQNFLLWKSEFQQKYLKENETREMELKEILKKQKDSEISLLMERLQLDTNKSKEELEAISDIKIKRIKEKFEKEISDLEQICENYKSKWSEGKRCIVEKDEQILEAQAQVRVKEKEMIELTKLIDKYSSERSSLREIISQEFKDRIIESENEASRLRQDIMSLRQTQKAEEVALRAESEQELQKVYQRVKTAVAKKDLAISKLKAKCESDEHRIKHLEALLEQNRIDYLKCSHK